MAGAAQVTEQRRHARVQLHLPMRLRWLGPLGSRIEVTESLDASCQGLLFHREEGCPLNAHVWVAFPFDAHATALQPEIPARVVRVGLTPTGGHLVAVEFELPDRRAAAVAERERRASPRVEIAVPIRLRPADAPWPEETMTIDVSEGGLRFLSLRLYAAGDILHIRLPYGHRALMGERPARVLRIEAIPALPENRVAVAFTLPAKS